MRKKGTNRIIADYGDWLLIDIATPTYKKTTMAVDKSVWSKYQEEIGSRVSAWFHKTNKSIYIYARSNGSCIRFHNYVLPSKDGFLVDHKKHGSMTFIDNRRLNLRYITSSQNAMNTKTRSTNTSGVRGVRVSKNRWLAYIQINGIHHRLGSYGTKEEAIVARKEGESKFFGDYAYGTYNKNLPR